MPAPVIAWFRRDLRCADNPALCTAAATGAPLIPLYIWCPEEDGPWAPASASRAWLHRSLAALEAEPGRHGSRLILRSGSALPVLRSVMAAAGVQVGSCAGPLLQEPGRILTKQGMPIKVFTAFWKRLRSLPAPPAPQPPTAPVCTSGCRNRPGSITP